ncbi:hypothetical protein PoB_003585300 [Plakobranchus ocellatus]|uniref:Resolvase/invertase-type recombinase catalytic domain-containing protein n=1 Tax=Plakobranchus ocellatus TaxID=259542 RepID=A0AAV4ARA8_9GAST|nr:hypothetical protein PoB_003585300 [Plakobranchus ocellatus]
MLLTIDRSRLSSFSTDSFDFLSVSKFKYLGYLRVSDDKCTSEVCKRTSMVKITFQKIKPMLANRNITVGTQSRIKNFRREGLHGGTGELASLELTNFCNLRVTRRLLLVLK